MQDSDRTGEHGIKLQIDAAVDAYDVAAVMGSIDDCCGVDALELLHVFQVRIVEGCRRAILRLVDGETAQGVGLEFCDALGAAPHIAEAASRDAIPVEGHEIEQQAELMPSRDVREMQVPDKHACAPDQVVCGSAATAAQLSQCTPA
ncbi:MAG: hypothetical protein AB7E80_01300 [Hyphomicrobiaceae bacterium]